MKQILLLLGLISILMFSCEHEVVELKRTESIDGGKGGTYNIAIFTLKAKKEISGKVYIQYGSKTIPNRLQDFDDSMSTMVEPGFGPHVHFNGLQAGFYAIKGIGLDNGNTIAGDTIIEIIDQQSPSVDYNLQLR